MNRNPRVSMRRVARETGIKRESIRLMAKHELNIQPYNFQKAQLLADPRKKVRVQRCRALLQRHAGPPILFTDEKIFTVEAYHNHQNDLIWAKHPPLSGHVVSYSKQPFSVMVWAGASLWAEKPRFLGT